ncbi:hypothetical protein [Xanthomonas prunicola]
MDRITAIARCIVLAKLPLCIAACVQPADAQSMRSAKGHSANAATI